MLYVNASHSLLNEVTEKHSNLLALIQELSGEKLRRVDRFTQLTIAGALGCVRRDSLAPGSALVLACSVGTLSTSIAIMKAIGEQSQPPKPFQFVNSLGNSACYFLAKMLNVTGPSLAISQEESSFEAALRHAEIILQSEDATQVLIGGVDEAPIPISDNLRRHGVCEADFSACYEGSHWLSVGARPEATTSAKITLLGSLRSAAGIEKDLSALSRADLVSVPRLSNVGLPADHETAGAQIFPHGTYSGHNFVVGCQMLEHSPQVLVITRRRGSNAVYYSLLEAP